MVPGIAPRIFDDAPPPTPADVAAGLVAPPLSEVERLRGQNALLQLQTAQQQITLLQSAVAKVQDTLEQLLGSIEALRPGWKVHRGSLRWQRLESAGKDGQ
jgi:hypothetical protein